MYVVAALWRNKYINNNNNNNNNKSDDINVPHRDNRHSGALWQQ